MRKTKIICTLGPATQSPEILQQLILAGANVFRLNMSHARHEWVREMIPRVRLLAGELDRPVAILLDTQGPAIRTGDVAQDLPLWVGDQIEFTVKEAPANEKKSVSVNYDGLVDDLSVEDVVLVDNGVIRLRVLSKGDARVLCEVLTPGTLGSRRHINLPGVKINLPALTTKDHADIALGIELEVDIVALSFVHQRGDVDELRALLRSQNSHAQVMAKIEDQSAVRLIHEVVAASDAVMIARGDLGIECPMEDLPIIQRKIVKLCARVGRPVVVATQLLESMIQNPLPTRAEITDVANAVFEEADAIMLSGETTVGRYPLECVRVLNRVAERIEASGGAGYSKEAALTEARQKTVAAAVLLANSLDHSHLVVFTRHGTMARYASNFRPPRSTIFAFTPNQQVQRQLALSWGVYPILTEFAEDDPNVTIERAQKFLREKNLVEAGDHLIVVSDSLAGKKRIDTVQRRIVG